MNTALRLIIACLIILPFWGCSTFPNLTKKSLVESIPLSLIGEWSGVHEIAGADYKRTWKVVYLNDGTYSSVHYVYLGDKPPRISKSSGYWKLVGDKYSQRIGGIDSPESFYQVKAIGPGTLIFKRSNGYSFKLERLK